MSFIDNKIDQGRDLFEKLAAVGFVDLHDRQVAARLGVQLLDELRRLRDVYDAEFKARVDLRLEVERMHAVYEAALVRHRAGDFRRTMPTSGHALITACDAAIASEKTR
jgi:hypothetical protein